MMKAFHPLWANNAAARQANLPSSPGLNGVTMRWRLLGGHGVEGTRGGGPDTGLVLGGWMGLRKQGPPAPACSPSRQGAVGAALVGCTLGSWASENSARRCFSGAERTLWDACLAQLDQHPDRRW
jgi:hypothetical protein